MQKLLLTICLVLAFSASAFGQMERTFYQSFEIDSVQSIALNLTGEFELSAWAGNTVLTETNIKLWEGSPAILDFFIKQGRYEIKMDKTEIDAAFKHTQSDRKPIKTQKNECTELVTLKVFVPDTYTWSVEDKIHLARKPKEN